MILISYFSQVLCIARYRRLYDIFDISVWSDGETVEEKNCNRLYFFLYLSIRADPNRGIIMRQNVFPSNKRGGGERRNPLREKS